MSQTRQRTDGNLTEKFISRKSSRSFPLAVLLAGTFATSSTVTTLLQTETLHAEPQSESQTQATANETSTANATVNEPVAQDTATVSSIWGWTTAHVDVHVRPSAHTPYLAQVPPHTRMVAWGRFDGWYRVEINKVFGWVAAEHFSIPEGQTLPTFSRQKMEQACGNSHNNTLYGSPDILRQYYARYRAPGALRGLKLQGASLAGVSKSNATGSSGIIYLDRNNGIASLAPMPVQSRLPAISADDIMRARASFLASQSKSSKSKSATAAKSRQSTSKTSEVEDTTASVTPSAAFLAPPAEVIPAIIGTGSATGSPRINTILNMKKSPVQVAAALPSAPTRTAPINRGGSPRDRALYMAMQGKSMATQALSYRGRPYIRGASSPGRGFDCSGLVYYLLRQRGYNPPRTAAAQSRYGYPVSKGTLQPGDMVFFANTYRRGVSHVGVYIGDGRFVHAASSGRGVRVDSLNATYYRRKWHSARRPPQK